MRLLLAGTTGRHPAAVYRENSSKAAVVKLVLEDSSKASTRLQQASCSSLQREPFLLLALLLALRLALLALLALPPYLSADTCRDLKRLLLIP